MAEAVFLVDIGAEPAAVRAALTTHDGIVGWWTKDAVVSDAELDLGFPDVPARFSLRVNQSSDERVAWSSVGDFPPHWVGTTITWELGPSPSGSGTQVFFTHGGFAAPDPMLGHTSYTWALLMGHLKGYVETGTANPFFATP